MPSTMIPLCTASSTDGPSIVAVMRGGLEPRVTERHSHERGQLLGATQGLLSVDAGDSQWVVPATHAVWIPPGGFPWGAFPRAVFRLECVCGGARVCRHAC